MDKKDAINIFSRGFAQFMDRKGYALKDVAKILGITEQSVFAFRAGDSLPSFEKVFTLIENGMTLEEIFGTELTKKREDFSNSSNKINAFNSPEFREEVVKIIADFIAKKTQSQTKA